VKNDTSVGLLAVQMKRKTLNQYDEIVQTIRKIAKSESKTRSDFQGRRLTDCGSCSMTSFVSKSAMYVRRRLHN